jgi:isopropylmalate/homocitrate/citramalate synthase
MIAPYKNASANFWIPASNDFIRRTLKKNYNEVIKNSVRLVKYFKKKWSQSFLDVALVDVTHREPNIEKNVSKFTKHLHNAGIRSVILCDTKGIATPEEIENLFKKVRQETNGSLEFHPHNDNGLALRNIEVVNKFGIKTIGVALFNSGERNTMLDPRDLLKAGYKINYRQKYLKKLEKEYKEKIGDPIKISKLIFGGKTIVTGTQYRLRHRFKEADLIFGVTSDKFILSKILNVKKEFISDKKLEKLKNDLYIKRKIFFTAQELLKMKNEILNMDLIQ